MTDRNYTSIAVELGGIVTIENEWGRGCGAVVTEKMADHALSLYTRPQVSVVRPNNIRSASIFIKLGWHQLAESSIEPILGFNLLEGGWEGSLVFCNPRSINQ